MATQLRQGREYEHWPAAYRAFRVRVLEDGRLRIDARQCRTRLRVEHDGRGTVYLTVEEVDSGKA